MTGNDRSIDERVDATRRATIRTIHDRPTVVAAAVAPDDTDEMATRVEGDAVVTEISRSSTGGLAATVDDYVVNVSVADRVAESAREYGRRDQTSPREHTPS